MPTTSTTPRHSTAAQFIHRAEEIAPTLIAQQAATEARGYYSEETHRIFDQAGFYRMLVPRSHGGHEVGIDTFSEVVKIIARGCPSTAWQLCFGASHAVSVCTMFPQVLWSEIFGDGHFISALTVKPQGSLVQQPDGDWVLNGTYDYCSGIPYSTHFSSQAMPTYHDGSRGSPVTFLARRDDWTMLNNWGDALGMKGSGSHSVRFENARIPDRFVLRTEVMNHTPAQRDPVNPSHGDSPMYYGRFVSFLIMEPASIAVGAMQGALDEYAAYMKSRSTMRPPIVSRTEDPDYRRWYGSAVAKVAVAEAALSSMVTQWQEACRKNMTGEAPFSIADEIRLVMIAGETIKICWDAMEIVWSTVGSSAARDGQRMQRLFRDLATTRGHALNTFFDLMSRELSDQLLGTTGGSRDSFFGSEFLPANRQRA